MYHKSILSTCVILLITAGVFAGRYQYQQVTTLQYGSADDQIGLIIEDNMPPSGPESFWVDNAGFIYVCDSVNKQVKKINPAGKIMAQKAVDFSANDIAVDNSGNIFLFDRSRRVIQQFSADGKTDEIDISKELNDTAFGLKIVDDELVFETGCQSQVQLTENKTLKSNGDVKNGIKGNNGKRFNVLRNMERKGEIDVTDENGNVLDLLVLPVDNVASIVFLGQDKKGNSYFQVEISKQDIQGVSLNVYCLNSDGDIDSVIADIPNNYYVWTAKLLQLGKNGDIYQVLPTEDNVQVNVWKRK